MPEWLLAQANNTGWAIGDLINATTVVLGVIIAVVTAHLRLQISKISIETDNKILKARNEIMKLVGETHVRRDVQEPANRRVDARLRHLEGHK